MSGPTLTTIIGLIVTALGTVAFPVYLNRRKEATSQVELQTTDSRAVAQMFKDERDRLQLRLDTLQASYERQITVLRLENEKSLAQAEAAWRLQHEADQRQIVELRDELQGLYRQLYRQQPPTV